MAKSKNQIREEIDIIKDEINDLEFQRSRLENELELARNIDAGAIVYGRNDGYGIYVECPALGESHIGQIDEIDVDNERVNLDAKRAYMCPCGGLVQVFVDGEFKHGDGKFVAEGK